MPTHRENVLKRYGLSEEGHSLPELARITGYKLSTLKEVEDRGYGAYNTNPTSVRMKGSFKKGVNAPMRMKLSPEQWSRARLYSFLDNNPKHDQDLHREDPGGRKHIALGEDDSKVRDKRVV